MKFRYPLASAILVALATAAPVQAQLNSNGGSWQAGSQPGIQTNEFWNNSSYDGGACNIGFFVEGSGFGPCINQNVSGGPLSWSNSAYLAHSSPGISSTSGFEFGAGSYVMTFLGQYAGANPHREMGIETSDGSNGVNGSSSVQFGLPGSSILVNASSAFKFYLQSYAPSGTQLFNSMDDSKQFAIFANSNGGNGDNTGHWIVGGEDNACAFVNTRTGCNSAADYDYNDGLVVITVAPEPSTYALMTAGLLVIGGLLRRRGNIAKN